MTKAYVNIKDLSSWATRFESSIIAENGLVIVPGSNLAINIGMDGGAHYEQGDINPYNSLKVGAIQWPLVYNDSQKVDDIQARYDDKDFLRLRFFGLKKRIRKLFVSIKMFC